MKNLIKLIFISLLGFGSACAQHQNVTVLPNGTGTGTINTPGITYYLWGPPGATVDFTNVTVKGISGGGGSTSPGGSNTQIQYNNSGAFGGTSGFTFNSTNQSLTLVGLTGNTFTLTSPANGIGMDITGSTTTNDSFGEFIQAGTSSSDFGLKVNTSAGGTELVVRGDGAVLLPQIISAAALATDANGKIIPASAGGGNVTGSSLTAPNIIEGAGGSAIVASSWSFPSSGVIQAPSGAQLQDNSGQLSLIANTSGNGVLLQAQSTGINLATNPGAVSIFEVQDTAAASTSNAADLYFNLKDSTQQVNAAQIISQLTNTTNATVTSYLSFQTLLSGTGAERMRLSAAGNLLVGTTTDTTGFSGSGNIATKGLSLSGLVSTASLATDSNGNIIAGSAGGGNVTGSGLNSGSIIVGAGSSSISAASPAISGTGLTDVSAITAPGASDITISSNGTNQNVNINFSGTGQAVFQNSATQSQVAIKSSAAVSTSNLSQLVFYQNDSSGIALTGAITNQMVTTTHGSSASLLSFDTLIGGSLSEGFRISGSDNVLIGTTSDTGVTGSGNLVTAGSHYLKAGTVGINVAPSSNAQVFAQWTASESAGGDTGLQLYPTINQTGNASYYGVEVSVTETSLGSGAHLLYDSAVNSTREFSVSDTGAGFFNGLLTTTATTTTPGLLIGGFATNPSSPTEGTIWENTTSHHFFGYLNGTVTQVDGGGGGGTPGGSNTQVQFNNSGSFGGSANFTWVSPLATLTNAGITSLTDSLLLTNTTAATVGVQEVSGALHFQGSGWKTTATAGPETVDMAEFLLPVQGTTQPTMQLNFMNQVNGGGYNNFLSITPGSTTAVTIASPGNFTMNTINNFTLTGGSGGLNLNASSGNNVSLGGAGATGVLTVSGTTVTAAKTTASTTTSTGALVSSGGLGVALNAFFGGFVDFVGITTGAAATTGHLGEVLSTTVPSGSAVSLTTATGADVATLALTAGDWEVSYAVYFQPAATTSVTDLQSGIGTSTGVLPALTSTSPIGYASNTYAAMVPAITANPISQSCGSVQINVSGSTTEHLVANATFTLSTMTAYGWIKARRVR